MASKKPTTQQVDDIRGAMGGWVYRTPHKVVSVGPAKRDGTYEAVVRFVVTPNRTARKTPAPASASTR